MSRRLLLVALATGLVVAVPHPDVREQMAAFMHRLYGFEMDEVLVNTSATSKWCTSTLPASTPLARQKRWFR